MKSIAAVAALAAALAGAFPLHGQGCVEVRREVYLMGTTATLTSCASTRENGLAQLESFLVILEAAEKELSTWIPESAISRLNRAPLGVPFPLNAGLTAMFSEVFAWQRKTGGAFDPAVGAITDAWGIHELGRKPTTQELDDARSRSGLHLFTFDANRGSITREKDVRIDVGAFGKGEGLDRVAAYARSHGSDPFLIDLGGQVLVYGAGRAEGRTVDLAHPEYRDRPALSIRLRNGSVSTSSGSERDVYTIDGERIGHHVDPRSAEPIVRNLSVVVWHERALIADMLSTALFVMGPEAGLAWAESHSIAAAFLIPRSGRGTVEARVTSRWGSALR